MVVIFIFTRRPAIEGLVHNHKTHTVAQIQELGCRRIMAGANRIDAKLAQNFQLALKRAKIQGSPQCAKIVMVADAIEFDMLAVEKKAFVHSEFNRADAKRGFVNVNRLPALLHRSDQDITLRFFQTPNFR